MSSNYSERVLRARKHYLTAWTQEAAVDTAFDWLAEAIVEDDPRVKALLTTATRYIDLAERRSDPYLTGAEYAKVAHDAEIAYESLRAALAAFGSPRQEEPTND